jgi:hypothetical protein
MKGTQSRNYSEASNIFAGFLLGFFFSPDDGDNTFL